MRGAGTAIVLVLAAALVGCGGSTDSKPDARDGGDFALAKMACGEGPKSDFAVGSVGIPADSSDEAIARGYAAQWPRGSREAVFAGCMRGLERAPARFPGSAPEARALWGRSFVATAVAPRGNGEEPPLAEPLQVRLWFSGEREHGISWKARCNSTGADARITARRIHAEMSFSTLIGCQAGPQAEDNWLSEFFESKPKWRLDGDRLRLASERAAMELKLKD